MSKLNFDIDVYANGGGRGIHRKTYEYVSRIFTLYSKKLPPTSSEDGYREKGELSFSFVAGEDIKNDKLTHCLYMYLNYTNEKMKEENLLMATTENVEDIESLRDYLTLFLKNVDKEEKKYEQE